MSFAQIKQYPKITAGEKESAEDLLTRVSRAMKTNPIIRVIKLYDERRREEFLRLAERAHLMANSTMGKQGGGTDLFITRSDNANVL